MGEAFGTYYEWAMSWTVTLTGGAAWFGIYSMMVVFLFSFYGVVRGAIGIINKYRKG